MTHILLKMAVKFCFEGAIQMLINYIVHLKGSVFVWLPLFPAEKLGLLLHSVKNKTPIF